MEKEVNGIKIIVPEGMEIDKENSTFEYIKFKKKGEVAWRNKEERHVTGWYNRGNDMRYTETSLYINSNYDIYATGKQAKSALAMAQISQIMANDERFGGVVTDEEWESWHNPKYIIYRYGSDMKFEAGYARYSFIAFHTEKQRDLFLKENEDLVKEYLMLD